MPIPITRKSNAFNSLPLIIQRLYSGSPLASKTSFEYTSPNYTARLDLFNSCSDRFPENLPFFDITMCYCCDIEFLLRSGRQVFAGSANSDAPPLHYTNEPKKPSAAGEATHSVTSAGPITVSAAIRATSE